MLKRVVIAFCVTVLLIAAVNSVGCGKAKEGQLPTYKVGTTWTYELSYGGSYYSFTYEVTGEGSVNGRDCWILKETITPALYGITSATEKYDKANLFPLQSQASGSTMGVSFTTSIAYSYQPADASYYPLEVGMEVTVTETNTTTTTVAGQATDPQTETITHDYKVEAVEEITVTAGTFKCFKITDGNATIWYSDKVKQDVKRIENDGTTQELTSYSV
jgi:hypothetical protein